jgi:hypothetical protein
MAEQVTTATAAPLAPSSSSNTDFLIVRHTQHTMSSPSSPSSVGDKRSRDDDGTARACRRNPIPGDGMVHTLSQGDADASPPSAAVRLLYRHALESIFAFCGLTELATVLRVSKDWAAAVHSMRPLDGQVGHMQSDLIPHLCASRLARHVGTLLAVYFQLAASPLCLVEFAQHMVHLRSLSCTVDLFDTTVDDVIASSRFVLPLRLRDLRMRFVPPGAQSPSSAASLCLGLNAAIVVIATLRELKSLTLVAETTNSCDLTPLASAPSLRTMQLFLNERALESATVIEGIRGMPLLRSLSSHPSATGFARMLQTPHTLKLDTLDLCLSPLTDEFAAAIVHLPTLTDLTFKLCTRHTDFLRQLPNLRRLLLHGGETTVQPDAERIMHSLHSLNGLTELSLWDKAIPYMPHHFHFTSDHLAACLPHMPLASCF